MKVAFRNYLLKVYLDKGLQWDILNHNKATLACQEVISAKRFFDDYFNKNQETSASSTSSWVAKKPRSCNLKPFKFTEDNRQSFLEDCQNGVYKMEQIIVSQHSQIANG